MEVRLFQKLDAHDGVVIEEPPRVRPIRTDSTYYGREMDDDVGIEIQERAIDTLLIRRS